jgi:hypothetical protein
VAVAVPAASFLLAVQKGATPPSCIGWVAVVVAAVSVVLAVQKGLYWHLSIRVLCLFGSDPKLTRCQ